MPSLTFVATAHAVRWLGLRPVFADVDPTSWTSIRPQGRGVGLRPARRRSSGCICGAGPATRGGCPRSPTRHQLALLFDAAHAPSAALTRAASHRWFGDAEAFSFHATKVANSFEGGAIATSDGQLAERAPPHDGTSASPNGTRSRGLAGHEREDDRGRRGPMGLTSLEALAALPGAKSGEPTSPTEPGWMGSPGLGLRSLPAPEEHTNHHHVIALVDRRAGGPRRGAMTWSRWLERGGHPGPALLPPRLPPHGALPDRVAGPPPERLPVTERSPGARAPAAHRHAP